MVVEAYGKSERGCIRAENEDRILFDASLGLFVVCDGMGGPRCGALAAELATAAIRDSFETSSDPCNMSWPFGYAFELSVDANRLATGVRRANRQVWRHAEQSLEFVGMGTSVAAVLLGERQAITANIGDSRVYRFRGGRLVQVSVDDTIIACMVQKGLLSSAEAAAHPMRNVVTQAAGSRENVEAHLAEETLQGGDTMLLCSDGLYSVVAEAEIQSFLGTGDSPEICVEHLVAAAIGAGAPDNVSAVVLRCS